MPLLNREDVLGEGVVRGRSGDAEAPVAKLADAGEAFGVLDPLSFQSELKEAERAREADSKAVGFAAGGLFVQDGGGLELFGEHQDADFARVEYSRSEEHTSELQSLRHLVCRLL